jgi:hypothetical protein
MKLWVGLILTTMVLGVMLLSGVVLAKKLVGGPGNNNYMGSNDTDYIYGGVAQTISVVRTALTISLATRAMTVCMADAAMTG